MYVEVHTKPEIVVCPPPRTSNHVSRWSRDIKQLCSVPVPLPAASWPIPYFTATQLGTEKLKLPSGHGM